MFFIDFRQIIFILDIIFLNKPSGTTLVADYKSTGGHVNKIILDNMFQW